MNRTLIYLLMAFCCVFMVDGKSIKNTSLNIWDGTKVRAKSVTLTAYLPAKEIATGVAVIVCPGGSYSWHDMKTEGEDVAQWLQSNGIAAFVLKYRVQGIFQFITHSRAVFGGNKHPNMIEDIQRAICIVREHATEYGIEPTKVGAMGFSAGGHLVMSAAEFYQTDFLAALGVWHTVSLRPDFVVPVYPVVTMAEPYVHKRSRRALLGERGQHNKTLQDSLSLEKHVNADCPAVFLVNCVDDPIVKYQNSELLDSALTVKGIEHIYLQYKRGGHGFGVSQTKGSEECRAWKDAFLSWISKLF